MRLMLKEGHKLGIKELTARDCNRKDGCGNIEVNKSKGNKGRKDGARNYRRYHGNSDKERKVNKGNRYNGQLHYKHLTKGVGRLFSDKNHKEKTEEL